MLHPKQIRKQFSENGEFYTWTAGMHPRTPEQSSRNIVTYSWREKGSTSSMQNKEAALIKVAGTIIQWQSSHSMTGNVRCQNTRNLEVSRVYAKGIGVLISCSQTPIPSWKQDIFGSCIVSRTQSGVRV